MKVKILRVNLSKESFREEEVEVDSLVGGRGLAVHLLANEVDPKVDPLSADNKIIFSIGPLTGTQIPFNGRCNVTSKSPLTGTICNSNAGGMFGYELSKTGYEAIIIEGKSAAPVYLKVSEEPEVIDASSIWGRTVSETVNLLGKEGIPKGKIACIGPAGENLVKFANIMVQGHRAFGRGGMGAVMGSKKLKAVILNGSKTRGKKYRGIARRLRKKVRDTPSGLKTQGTSNILAVLQGIGALPTKNFQLSHFENADRINGEALKKHTLRSDSCHSCIVACKRITESKRYNIVTDGPEYETLAAFGSYIFNDDLESIIKANDLCDDVGVDTISMGSAVAHFMEAEERWGDYELAHRLILETAYRKGIGKQLAEGTQRYAESIGIEPIVIRGMDLPGYHPKALYGQGLAFLTSNRGADHLYSSYYLEEIGRKDRKKLNREKIAGIIENENKNAILDSLILCKFSLRFYNMDDYLKLLSLAMGREVGRDEFHEIGERIIEKERNFNLKAGVNVEDRLPKRISIPGADQALREYYVLRGWK
jgi:aldehyde:ferredoxin oxidoreductase